MLKIDSEKFYDEVVAYQCENMFEADSLQEELTTVDPKGKDSFDLSVNIDGLRRCNLWLNNMSCDKFDARLDSFKKIMNDRRMKIIEKNFEIASYTQLYLEYGEEYMQDFINCMDKYNISMDQDLFKLKNTYFTKAVSQLRYFLNDSSYDEFENKSHYVFCDCCDDWDSVDYYKMFLANHKCVELLDAFRNGLKEKEKAKINKSK